MHAEQKLSRCRERGRCVCALNRNEQTDGERGRCVCMLNRNLADRRREREREVCVRAEQKLSRCRERGRCVCALNRNEQTDGEREREGEVCVHAEQKLSRAVQREICVCVC